MKHLAPLAALYAVIAALVLPSSLLASDPADPVPTDAPATETAPAAEAPAAPPEPVPAPQEAAEAPQPAAPAPEQGRLPSRPLRPRPRTSPAAIASTTRAPGQPR